MNYAVKNNKEETSDRWKSAIITVVCTFLVFLLVYYYQYTRLPEEKPQAVTTMLINFGDNRNGDQTEEPANQEGSQAPNEIITESDIVPEVQKQEVQTAADRLITGNNTKVSVPKSDAKINKAKTLPAKANTKKATAASKSAASKNNGDGRGNAAVGNLLKGRGTAAGSQGNSGTTGNAGDPLGGDGNGDSKIGVDRKLTGFIPGTMGRGGAQPSNSCSASGAITISFSVDKAGNVVSARRAGGVSDPCVVSTSVSWVKQYVKAERASTTSTGSYKIIF